MVHEPNFWWFHPWKLVSETNGNFAGRKLGIKLAISQKLANFHLDDVFIFSDIFKRHLGNFSVIYFSSTPHVLALALFMCDIQLINDVRIARAHKKCTPWCLGPNCTAHHVHIARAQKVNIKETLKALLHKCIYAVLCIHNTLHQYVVQSRLTFTTTIIPSEMEVAPHPQNCWYHTEHKTI